MYNYTLPNGAEIDIELFVEAMLAEEEYPSHFFDTKTGCIVHVPSRGNLKHWVDDIGTSERYFLIERLTDEARDVVAFDFLENIVDDLMIGKEMRGARKALAKGGWRAMKEFLEESTEGWVGALEQFIYDEAFARADDWLINDPRVGAKTTFTGCGDCPACELLRIIENSDAKDPKTAITTEEAMQNVRKHLKELGVPKTSSHEHAGARKSSPNKNKNNLKKKEKPAT